MAGCHKIPRWRTIIIAQLQGPRDPTQPTDVGSCQTLSWISTDMYRVSPSLIPVPSRHLPCAQLHHIHISHPGLCCPGRRHSSLIPAYPSLRMFLIKSTTMRERTEISNPHTKILHTQIAMHSWQPQPPPVLLIPGCWFVLFWYIKSAKPRLWRVRHCMDSSVPIRSETVTQLIPVHPQLPYDDSEFLTADVSSPQPQSIARPRPNVHNSETISRLQCGPEPGSHRAASTILHRVLAFVTLPLTRQPSKRKSQLLCLCGPDDPSRQEAPPPWIAPRGSYRAGS